jgi:ligand-binding sensor domain-containing protein
MKKTIVTLLSLVFYHLGSAQTWTTYDTSNTSGGLKSNTLTEGAIDKDGNKWFGSEGYGVSKFDGTTWTNYIDVDTLTRLGSVTAIAVDKHNTKWVCTLDGGVYRFDGTSWILYNARTTNFVFPESNVFACALDSQDNKWFGIPEGMMKYDGTTWTHYKLPKDLEGHAIEAIAIDAEGNKWCGLNTQAGCKIGKFDGTDWIVKKEVLNTWIKCITIDHDGAIWTGTHGAGVYKFDGDTWSVYTTKDGLALDFITSIVVDAQNNKWVGTYKGLSVFNGSSWKTDTIGNGVVPFVIRSITLDKNNLVWYATNSGVLKFQDKITGIDATQNGEVLNVFPNPSSKETNISFPYDDKEAYTLTIYDIQGREALQMDKVTGGHAIIPSENMTHGLYYFTLSSKKKERLYSGKFMVSN